MRVWRLTEEGDAQTGLGHVIGARQRVQVQPRPKPGNDAAAATFVLQPISVDALTCLFTYLYKILSCYKFCTFCTVFFFSGRKKESP